MCLLKLLCRGIEGSSGKWSERLKGLSVLERSEHVLERSGTAGT